MPQIVLYVLLLGSAVFFLRTVGFFRGGGAADRMEENMEIINVAIRDIHPYPNNPRKNSDAVDTVAESIRQCGYCAPIIVDEDHIILAGHTRYKALKKLGWQECPVLLLQGMSDEQKRKYRLLDNKTVELATWDLDALAEELEALDFDGFDFGFEAPETVAEEEAQDDGYEVAPLHSRSRNGGTFMRLDGTD